MATSSVTGNSPQSTVVDKENLPPIQPPRIEIQSVFQRAAEHMHFIRETQYPDLSPPWSTCVDKSSELLTDLEKEQYFEAFDMWKEGRIYG